MSASPDFDGRPGHVTGRTEQVFNPGELIAATRDSDVGQIVVDKDIDGLTTRHLSAGQTPQAGRRSRLHFAADQDGLRLTSGTAVRGLTIETDADRLAIYNDTTVAGLGCLELQALPVIGCVRLLARVAVRTGFVRVEILALLGSSRDLLRPAPARATLAACSLRNAVAI